jgi:DNA replication and repair protein RecF
VKPVSKPFTLERLAIRQLRNLEHVELEPAARMNVISGSNGHGKTSVLEAIYVLCTTHSFRTARMGEVVRHGEKVASVRGTVHEHWDAGPIAREQSVGLDGGRRRARINGTAPPTLTVYATRSPVVVFGPEQLTLSTGPSGERRTLLDRVTLFTHEEVGEHRSRYQRAMRERLRLLADRGPRSEGGDLLAFESLLAEHGAAITRARAAASVELYAELGRAWARIAAPELALQAVYAPGGSADVEEARARLAADRVRDAARKATSFGPHRDDMALSIDGHPARQVASQGQHRALTLALKSAELACIARARGLEPLLLLDDVSSELDAERTAALFEFLAETRSQIFLTTTRAGLIPSPVRPEERRDFELRSGALAASPA